MNQILYKGEIFGGVGEDVTNKQYTITLDEQTLETIGGENSEIFNSYKDKNYKYRNICEGDYSTVIGISNKVLKYVKENNTWVRPTGFGNDISSYNNFIGGSENLITGTIGDSIVFGGHNKVKIGGNYNAIFGSNHEINTGSTYGIFIAGQGNKILGPSYDYCSAVFGSSNILKNNNSGSLLVGGSANRVESSYQGIICGYGNQVYHAQSPAVFGQSNIVGNSEGGEHNISISSGGMVSGKANRVGMIDSGVHVLGVRNQVGYNTGACDNGTLVCGDGNTVSSSHASLISGENNVAQIYQQAMLGGTNCKVGGFAALTCGSNLTSDNVNSSIFTGYNNKAQSIDYSLVSGSSSSFGSLFSSVISGYNNTLIGSNSVGLLIGQRIKVKNGQDNLMFGDANSIYGKQNFTMGKDNRLGIFANKDIGCTYDTLESLNTLQTRQAIIDGVTQTVTYHKININVETEQEFTLGTFTPDGTEFDENCCVDVYDPNTHYWQGTYVWDNSNPEHPYWNNNISSIGKFIIGRTHEKLSDSTIASKTTLLVYHSTATVFIEENSTYNAPAPEGQTSPITSSTIPFNMGDIVSIFTSGQSYDPFVGTYIFNGEQWVEYNKYNYKEYYSSNNIVIGNKNLIIPDITSYYRSNQPYAQNKQYGNNLLLFSDNNKLINGKNNILINSYGLTLDNDYTQTSIKTEKSIFINYDTNNNSISNVNKVLNFGTNNLSGVDNSFIFTSSSSPNTVSSTAGVFTFGSGNTINSTCYILGSSNTINAGNSVIIGDGNSATMGAYLYGLGTRNTLLQGSYLYGFGEGLTLSLNSHAVAIGYYNNNVSGSVFIVGNGNSEWSNNEEIITRSNAFEVYKDGSQTIILKDKTLSGTTLGIGKIEITQGKIKFTSLKDNSNNEKETVEFTFEELQSLKNIAPAQNINNTPFPQI